MVFHYIETCWFESSTSSLFIRTRKCFFKTLLCFLKIGLINAEGTTCFKEPFVSSNPCCQTFFKRFLICYCYA